MATSNQPIVANKTMQKSIFASQTIWRTVLAGVVYLAPLTVLELGMVLVMPSMFNPIPAEASQQSLQAMLDDLGRRETRDQPGAPYKVENGYGFLGKYQFGEALLIDLGYYTPKDCVWYLHGADKNYWKGTWKINNIRNKQDFLNSPNAQEQLIRQAFALNWHYINTGLKEKGKSMNEYLNSDKTFQDAQGKPQRIKITTSGILAGAHLVGNQNVVDFLTQGKLSKDEHGTYIYQYMQEFGRYNITPADFGESRQPKPSNCPPQR